MCLSCVIVVILALLTGMLLLCWRRSRWLGALLIVAAICAAGYAIVLDRRYQRAFPSIVDGDTEVRVRELMGRPASITDGTRSEYGYPRAASEVRSDVAQEYWYYCIYAPHVWAVSFDKERKVVRKYELISP